MRNTVAVTARAVRVTGGAAPTAGWGRRTAAACLPAALAALLAGCANTPLYGPAGPASRPTPAAAASTSLRFFQRAENGAAAQAFRADAAIFNRDSRSGHVAESVVGEDAYQVSADLHVWAVTLGRAPVPPGYRQAKAHLLAGLRLLQQGYHRIGDGLLYQDAGQLQAGRADVRAGSRILRAAYATDASL